MSRLPPFIRKNATTAVATATVATAATVTPDCSNNSGCSSSSPPDAGFTAAPAVASVAAVAAASAADRFSERWRDMFEERAAVREFDAGLSRADAEAAALLDLAQIWQCENPLPASDAAACVHCGRKGADTPVLARGGHAWLHRQCWGPMNAERQQEAVAAVRALLGGAP